MTTLAQVRKAALALPDVTESRRDGVVAFNVSGSEFASVLDGVLRLRLAPADVASTLTDLPQASKAEGRAKGIHVDLAAINGMQSNALVRRAWLATAPNRLAEPVRAADGADRGVGDLPVSLGRPATRALVAAGITSLADVAPRSETELADLHGIGPKSLRILREALAEQGRQFRPPA